MKPSIPKPGGCGLLLLVLAAGLPATGLACSLDTRGPEEACDAVAISSGPSTIQLAALGFGASRAAPGAAEVLPRQDVPGTSPPDLPFARGARPGAPDPLLEALAHLVPGSFAAGDRASGEPRGGIGGGPGDAPVHVVVPGDTLSGLAARYCGSAGAWPHIFQANRDRIRNPHWIYPGQEFRIACGPGGAPGRAPGGDPGARAGGGRGGFARTLPLAPGSYRVSSVPGDPRDGGRRKHAGVDLSATTGTPIRSVGPGVVTRSAYVGGYGWVVYVRHPDGTSTRYAHMVRRPSVKEGQPVNPGDLLGNVGSTGNSTGPHLHFEVRNAQGVALDPRDFFDF